MTEAARLGWEVVTTLGAPAWTLVVANEPRLGLDAYQVNAVPDVTDWETVYGSVAGEPVELRYGVSRSAVRLSYACRAKYHGHGAYLPAAWFEVVELDPRYQLTISAEVHGPENVGATPEEPIAALGFSVIFHERSGAGQAYQSYNVWIYGDGREPYVSES